MKLVQKRVDSRAGHVRVFKTLGNFEKQRLNQKFVFWGKIQNGENLTYPGTEG